MGQDPKDLKPVPLVSQCWIEPSPVPPSSWPGTIRLAPASSMLQPFIVRLCLGSRPNSCKVLPYWAHGQFSLLLKFLSLPETKRLLHLNVLSVPAVDLPGLPWDLAPDHQLWLGGQGGEGCWGTDLPSLSCAPTSFL